MAPRRIVLTPAAERELDSAADRLALAEGVGLALRFLASAEATFRRLSERPWLGRRRSFEHPELRDVRSWRLKGFDNWLVFYRASGDELTIVSVVHGARDLDALFDGPEPQS